jgi:hypothetical protein
MTKYAAVAAIHGDADAYVNPCVADGSGMRGRSSSVSSRCGVRGEPCGGRAPIALDQVGGLRQEHHHIIQYIPSGELRFTPTLSITCTGVSGQLVSGCGN